MYSLRTIVLLVTSFTATSLLIFVALGTTEDGNQEPQSGSQQSYTSRFSFASPGSLFPPSAVISLTDDNSTFFLARPAAFGPDLPANSLSGPLWVGRGFADDGPSKAELGCGDVPDWEDEEGTSATNPLPKFVQADHDVQNDHLSGSATAELQGSIALLKRGGCGFLAKVQWAQNRGALAVIVGDDVRGGGLVRMYAKGDTSNVTIPSLFTSHTTAHLLSSLLEPRRAVQNVLGSPPRSNTQQYRGDLWVTLTPTNISTSPFFDTLLVLVVSPLVTLTVVYALLLLRSRIRRRRWRAPKSLVERLPVRTYEAISSSSSSCASISSSPTAPLLQREASDGMGHDLERTSPLDQGVQPRPIFEHQDVRSQEVEKRETGLAEWRRRYGGRQKECVICLEEYVTGVSQVMRLPCGHEFHADCITPWLVTRRRICPICKGDVVRSLAQSFHERSPSDASTQTAAEVLDVANEEGTTIHRASTPATAALLTLPMDTPSISPSTENNQQRDDDDRTIASSAIPPRTVL